MRRYNLEEWPFRPYYGNLARNLARLVHDTGSNTFFRTSEPARLTVQKQTSWPWNVRLWGCLG